jgi:hypothetical protein
MSERFCSQSPSRSLTWTSRLILVYHFRFSWYRMRKCDKIMTIYYLHLYTAMQQKFWHTFDYWYSAGQRLDCFNTT